MRCDIHLKSFFKDFSFLKDFLTLKKIKHSLTTTVCVNKIWLKVMSALLNSEIFDISYVKITKAKAPAAVILKALVFEANTWLLLEFNTSSHFCHVRQKNLWIMEVLVQNETPQTDLTDRKEQIDCLETVLTLSMKSYQASELWRYEIKPFPSRIQMIHTKNWLTFFCSVFSSCFVSGNVSWHGSHRLEGICFRMIAAFNSRACVLQTDIKEKE